MTQKPEKPAKKGADVDSLLTEVTQSVAKTAKAPEKKPAAKAAAAPAPAKPKAEKPEASKKTLRIRQIRSGICTPIDQKQTLLALGLRRIRQEVVRQDTPSIRGQIHKIRHLVELVEE
jgi:large subunit ribosomal protein L30